MKMLLLIKLLLLFLLLLNRGKEEVDKIAKKKPILVLCTVAQHTRYISLLFTSKRL